MQTHRARLFRAAASPSSAAAVAAARYVLRNQVVMHIAWPPESVAPEDVCPAARAPAETRTKSRAGPWRVSDFRTSLSPPRGSSKSLAPDVLSHILAFDTLKHLCLPHITRGAARRRAPRPR